MSQSASVFSYIPRDTPVHRLCGATKMIVFLSATLVSMLSYNTFVLLGLLMLSVAVFLAARIQFHEVRFIFFLTLIFLLMNDVAIYIFSPEEGVKIYGARHELFRFTSRYTVTLEQLFYMLNITLKYISVVPFAMLFIVTTDPSEMAASLTRLGVSYKISYAFSITLRYIADIQTDFHEISQAQQARGVDFSTKVSLKKRLSGLVSIAVPLIFSSLDRINLISNAMDLRGFGKKDRRTWYSERQFSRTDRLTLIATLIISVAALYLTFKGGSRFYNPF